MEWSEAKRAGFALAAVLWEDRSLDGVSSAVRAGERDRAQAALTALQGLDAHDKSRRVRELVLRVRGELQESASELPARARVLLARHVPRELGRRWLDEAPSARRNDFAEEPGLVATLARIARSERAGEDHADPHPQK